MNHTHGTWESLPSLVTATLCLFLFGCNHVLPQERRDTSGAEEPVPEKPAASELPRTQTPGHRRMLDLLTEIARRTPEEHPYLGDRRARELRQQLASLDEEEEDADPLDRWLLHLRLGAAELDLGNVRTGIEHLSRAHQLLPQVKAKIKPFWANETIFQLGMGYLRLGEIENCALRHTAESCIVPIRKEGVHVLQEGSRKAIRHFLELLNETSEEEASHLSARWLLNIAYMTIGGYPDDVPGRHLIPPKAFESEIDFPRFQNIAPKLGLDTMSLSGGAIVDDFDNDDFLDIVTSSWDVSGPMRLFRNNRDGTFSERSREAGLTGLYGGLNLKQADYDNDGNLDILVLRGAWAGKAGRHPNSLLRNQGDGTFRDVTFEAGLGEVHYPTQTAAWADYDNDGDLDLYIGNEATAGFAAPGQLFRNNGDGTFTDVAAQAGVQNQGYTKGVAWGDYNSDRFPDLYVSNYQGPNRLYHNNSDGTFTDVAPRLQVGRPKVSFPVWFWDFDNDGVRDLFVPTYEGFVEHVAAYYLGLPPKFELACLYRGDGQGGFQEVAKEYNLDYPMLPMGSNFGDLNNDGYLDFYLGTGDPAFKSLMPNIMFLNDRGKRFTNVTMGGGFGHLQKGHSVAFADLDNDGDLDIFEQMGGAFPGDPFSDALYENPGFGNHWITVKLVGVQSNRSALGARIRVEILEEGKMRSIYRDVDSGGSFGGNPLRQTIGLGRASKIRVLEVFWPATGLTQVFSNIPFDQIIQIVEASSEYTTLSLKRLRF